NSSDLAAIYGKLSEQLLTEYSVEYRSGATDLPGGSTVPFEITLGRAGAILARTTGSFTVPAGTGQARPPVPTTAPAPAAAGVTEFLGLRFAATILSCAVITTIVVVVNRSPGAIAVALVIGAAAGFVTPGIALTMITRGRRSAMQRALIPSLDMLALSAEAGLAFDGAIAQVVLRWRNPLSDELRRLLLEFQMGRERKQALRGLARR